MRQFIVNLNDEDSNKLNLQMKLTSSMNGFDISRKESDSFMIEKLKRSLSYSIELMQQALVNDDLIPNAIKSLNETVTFNTISETRDVIEEELAKLKNTKYALFSIDGDSTEVKAFNGVFSAKPIFCFQYSLTALRREQRVVKLQNIFN